MKYKAFISIIILTALSMTTGCQDEQDVFIPVEKEDFVTFSLPGMAKSAVTYADPIASPEENELVTLDIYMFSDETDQSGTLERIFRFGGTGNDQLDLTGQTPTATVDLTGRFGTKNFHFLANAGNRISGIGTINVGETTEADFLDMLTTRQTALISTPLLMSGSVTLNLDQPIDNDMRKVTLQRRVARFDVSNIEVDTHFKIGKILVSGINLQGYLFGSATSSVAIPTGKLPEIDFSNQSGANNGDTPGVFYLYPSTLKSGNVAFEGIFNNETKVYELKLENNVSIEANKRYTLKAATDPLNDIIMELNVADWNVGDEHEAKQGENRMEFPIANRIKNSNIMRIDSVHYDFTYSTSEAKITVPVKTYNKKQAQISINYKEGSKAITDIVVNTPEPVLTYSAGYLLEYEIIIPARSNMDAKVEAEILIINDDDPEQRMAFTVKGDKREKYPDTEFYPIIVGGYAWAPVNTGATSLTDPGYHHQWGRNYGARGTATPNDLYGTMGPISIIDANENPNVFIKAPRVVPYDWLNSQDSMLWSGSKRKGPCPEGWRVPVRTELIALSTAYHNAMVDEKKVFENDTFVFPADNTDERMYLPLTGYRLYQNGLLTPNHTYLWGAEVDATYKEKSVTFYINNKTHISSVTNDWRGYGFAVRCVKDI